MASSGPHYLIDKVIRLRCKKPYPDAHNHVIIGRVVDENESYIAVLGRSFHFAGILDRVTSKINPGRSNAIRVIPWGNVELIHVLDGDRINWSAEILFDNEKKHFFLDDEAHTVIAGRHDGITN